MALNDKVLRSKTNLPTDKPHKDIADGGGLLARFSKSGNVTFYYRYRYGGKPVILKLGNYPEVSLKEAREKHTEARKALDEGKDPRAEREKERNAHSERLTIKAGFDFWYENYLTQRNKKACNVWQILNKHVLPKIGDRIFDDMTPQDWINVCRIELKVTSTMLLAYCKQCSKYLLTIGMIKTNTAAVVQSNYVGEKSRPRQRVLTMKELATIYNRCDEIAPSTAAAMMIMMFMGARSGEVRTLEVGDVNEDYTVWTVPEHKSKTELPIVRPIPEFVRPHFRYLMDNASKCGLCFTGWYDDKVLKESGFYERIRNDFKPCGVKKWSPHVLRHTLSTHFADLEIEPYVAEKMLGHIMGGTMGVYNKGQYLKQQLKAMTLWHDAVNNVRLSVSVK